jgi:hypothetical protein
MLWSIGLLNYRVKLFVFICCAVANCVIYVRRGIVEGVEQSTKTENGEPIIDIDPKLAELLITISRIGNPVAFFRRVT